MPRHKERLEGEYAEGERRYPSLTSPAIRRGENRLKGLIASLTNEEGRKVVESVQRRKGEEIVKS